MPPLTTWNSTPRLNSISMTNPLSAQDTFTKNILEAFANYVGEMAKEDGAILAQSHSEEWIDGFQCACQNIQAKLLKMSTSLGPAL